jgi:peptidoglycan/LPS O-acetylase OafA/YrhL
MPSAYLKEKQHIYQVDYIRAIASLAVALFHLGGKVLPVLKYGWLGVQLFFFLSGFIICWAIPKGYGLKVSGKFILKRIIRIEPPYIISVALVVAMQFLLQGGYQPDWKNIFFHFAYLNTFFHLPYLNPVYWTLAVEFQFYLLIAFIFPLIIKRWGCLVVLLLCFSPFIVHINALSLIATLPVFAAGMFYYQYRAKLIGLNIFIPGELLALACCYETGGLLPMCATILALLILLAPLKGNKIVTFFANISFSLYLTHDIVGSNLVVRLGQILPKTTEGKGICFISGIIVSIAFAYLFYLAIERPFVHLSKKIRYKEDISAK